MTDKMKHLLCTLVALMAVAGAAAQPQVQWESTDHNFGAFAEDDGTVTCDFTYTNTGDEPLVIVSARASCGCTIPSYSTKPIEPGATGTVSVKFEPTGRAGRFEKKIYIDTNTEPQRSVLTIRGTVVGAAGTIGQRYPVDLGALRLRSGVLLIGDVTKDRIKSVFFEGYNDGLETIRPTVTYAPKYLEVTTVPEAVGPGEQFSFVVVVHSDRTDLYGVAEDSLTFVADPVLYTEPHTIPTVAIINEDFSKLTPGQLQKAPKAVVDEGQRLDFGRFDRTGGPLAGSVTLRNTGKSKLIIRRVYGGDGVVQTIDCSRREIKPGQTASITVTVDPSKIKGEILNERLSIITNDPDKPNTLVRLVGEPR